MNSVEVVKTRVRNACETWVDQVMDLGVEGISLQFNTLEVPDGPCAAYGLPENIYKNRYLDVQCFDATRVILKENPNGSDYINASYVQTDDMMFICTQGPRINTIEDFWIMILQEQTKIIVQLCAYVENGRDKCTPYFPSMGASNYGSVSVQVSGPPVKFTLLPNVTCTNIIVSHRGLSQEVLHIGYEGWPDCGIPDSLSVCREICTFVLNHHNNKPVVVHCSAGIGRTGTFVAIEQAIQKLRKGDPLDLRDVVRSVRQQRKGAIINCLQYLYIFRLMLEVLIVEGFVGKDQRVTRFINQFESLYPRAN